MHRRKIMRRQREGSPVKEEAEIGVMLSDAKKCLGPSEPGREALAHLIPWVTCLFLAGLLLLLNLDCVDWGVALRWLYNCASLNCHPPCSLRPLTPSWVLDGLLVCKHCPLVGF